MKKLNELYEIGYRDVYAPNPNGGIPIKQAQQQYLRAIPVKTAGSGFRFLHWLVDYFGVQFMIGFFGYFLGMAVQNTAISTVAGLAFFVFYYAGMEALVGQTLAKMLTGSVVVDEYGQKIDFQTALLRTIIRIVPFDPLTFFGDGRGWHDRWSKTYVMNKKELAVRLEKLENEDEQNRIINSMVAE